MKIYTRTGDQGNTGLFGGARVRKNDRRVEAYGTIDELNASLGFVRSQSLAPEQNQVLERIQGELFVLGAEVACEPGKEQRLKMKLIDSDSILFFENLIDEYEEALEPLRTFILPCGSKAGAALHLSRTIARRAERRCLDVEGLRPMVVMYINRLSDFLFVMARRINQLDGVTETPWTGNNV